MVLFYYQEIVAVVLCFIMKSGADNAAEVEFCQENLAAFVCSMEDINAPKKECGAASNKKAGFSAEEADKIVKDINEFRRKWVEGDLEIKNPKYRFGRNVMLMKWNNQLQKAAQVHASYCSKISVTSDQLKNEFPSGFASNSHMQEGHFNPDDYWAEIFKNMTAKELEKFADESIEPGNLTLLGKHHLIGCGIMSVITDLTDATVSNTVVCHLVHGPLKNTDPVEGLVKEDCGEDCPEHTFCTTNGTYRNLMCEWDGGSTTISLSVSLFFLNILMIWIIK